MDSAKLSAHVGAGATQFQITVEQQDGTISVGFAGEVDCAVEDEATQTLRSLAATTEISRMLIDVSAITFIDSSGVRCLLQAQQAATDLGLDFHLVGDSNVVSRVLEICGLTEHFCDH